MKWHFIVCFSVFYGQFGYMRLSEAGSQRAYMVVGEQRKITLPGLKRYALDQNQVLKVLPFPAGRTDELLIRALKPGITKISVWLSDGESEIRTLEILPQIKAGCTSPPPSFLELTEVDVIPILGGVSDRENSEQCGYLIRGEYNSVREGQLVLALSHTNSEKISNTARPSLALYEESKSKLENYLSQLSTPSLKIISNKDARSILIYGSAPNPIQKDIWIREILSRAPFALGHITTLPDDSPVIHFKVYLLEVNRSYLRNLGFQLPQNLTGTLSGLKSLKFKNSSTLESSIQALEQNGQGRVLSQPELVVRAPGKAELFAGGEIPIETKTAYSSYVQWKRFGLQLQLEVQAITGQKLRADLLTEVSSISNQTSNSNSLPGIQANRMKTQIDAEFGEPLVFSGLIQENTRSLSSGLPWLSRVPILGLLFRSDAYIENRSDFVAVLMPERTLPKVIMEALSDPKLLGFPKPKFSQFRILSKGKSQ